MPKYFPSYFSTFVAFTLLTSIGTIINTSNALSQDIPKAQCVSAYGETKCGYSCVASYGDIKCADWAGGSCKAAYGEIVCGPPAPPNWLNAYTGNSSNNSGSGIRGAWAVKRNNGYTGLLRMNGNNGSLVLVSGASVIEQQMALQKNPNGGYVLVGKVSAMSNTNGYNADSIYFQEFTKSFAARSCDRNGCSNVNLTYLGK
ncbi:MAG: hypothetical protein WCP16_16655 [Pseudanabaena sp. ELA645]